MAEDREQAAGGPSRGRRRWWLVAAAALAALAVLLMAVSGPVGWGALVLVWAVLLLARQRQGG